MPAKIPATLLSNLLSSPGKGEKSFVRQYIEIILSEKIPILCINQETGKKRLMPFKVLYDNNELFWQQGGAWKYYISGEDYKKVKEIFVSTGFVPGEWDTENLKLVKPAESPLPSKPEPASSASQSDDEDLEELEVEVGYGRDYETIIQMNNKEKIVHMFRQKQRLNELLALKTKDTHAITETLVDTTKDAALINHAAMEEAMILADDEAKRFTQEFVDSTHEMVKLQTQLIAEDVLSNEMMNTLVKKSNGTIVQHMTRVYLNGISFLAFYNKLVTTSSAIQKLRIAFSDKYRHFYKEFLPHISHDDVDLERVFLGGMRAISPEMLSKWAVGFLIHDIGKASAIEYHEGESNYDRVKVTEHVKAGYKSVMTKTTYPMEASLITGYHHEYYGDSDGYGYFRAYLQQYKKQNPSAKQDFIITYDLEPMLDYQALAYFPAKVLEIVDVYDSLTDPCRIYHKALSSDDALALMRKEFIENKRKLDIILFDIFIDFVNQKLRK
ncbi:MAG: metal-dependent phosphohydrolase [Treponema sp.]|jgi:HD-GYP domain-containing protein (c-di-GMP phosphodiesterase class II)|nr:metal-dependent phosphohydrolase [Treponema sp.]